MLRQRVITALILLALLLPALFAVQTWPFAVLTLVMIAAAGWEWGRLNGAGSGAASMGLGLALAVACAAALGLGWSSTAPPAAWWLATLLWVLGGAWALRGGPGAWPKLAPALRWLVGVLLLWVAWLAIVNAKAIGINFILSVFCLVWAADIAAYFGGRAFGRRKLAPSISPGKTWEGVWTGMLGALMLAGFWLWLDRSIATDSASLYSRVASALGLAGLLPVVLFLAAMSVVGDLFESLVKRSVGAKDSSGLLPGHGGLLDRFDALLPVFPIAMAMGSL